MKILPAIILFQFLVNNNIETIKISGKYKGQNISFKGWYTDGHIVNEDNDSVPIIRPSVQNIIINGKNYKYEAQVFDVINLKDLKMVKNDKIDIEISYLTEHPISELELPRGLSIK